MQLQFCINYNHIKSFEKEFPDLTEGKYIIYNGEDKGEINGVNILNYRSFFKIQES